MDFFFKKLYNRINKSFEIMYVVLYFKKTLLLISTYFKSQFYI